MHNTKKIAYIQKLDYANKATCQLFCSPLLFCFRELDRFLEISVRDPRKILRVSQLETRTSTLDRRKSKLETRASKLDSQFSKDRESSFESRLSTYL